MSSALHTRLCEILGIRHPIIQTAMGWIATPEMVAACCNAGAIGFLATATVRAEEVDALISRVEELTDRPFGVNFLMEAPGAELIVDTIIRHGVKAASYARSPNPEFIKRFKDAGILCVPTCGAVRHAQKAVQLGADIVIVQGGEGGGHTGSVPTSILVPQVVDAIDEPVVAAGGFSDGRGLVAALAFGAAGIAMGTRFLLTSESPMPAETAERYFAATVNDSSLVFGDVDFLSGTQHVDCDIFQFHAKIFRDHLAASQDRNVLQHGFTTIAETRCFHSCDFQAAAQFVHNQSRKRFAFNIFCDDEKWFL